MTCTIGFITDTHIHLGSDGMASNGHTKTTVKHPKIFQLGECLVGFAGSFNVQQSVQFLMSVPPVMEGIDNLEYMITYFVPALKNASIKGNAISERGYLEGNLLVGFRGSLFEIQPDFSVLEVGSKYICIGSGGESAAAAMVALEGLDLEPQEKIKRALEAASSNITSVGPPYSYASLQFDEEIKISDVVADLTVQLERAMDLDEKFPEGTITTEVAEYIITGDMEGGNDGGE